MTTISDDTLIKVQNLTDHIVGYKTYDGNKREFKSQQIFEIPAKELRQMKFTRGGQYLLEHCLSVRNRAFAIEDLGVDPDVFDNEYQWTIDDVKRCLKEGSIDELADALDFAPDGIKEMIVDGAIKMNLRDVAKRELIKEMTGKDITEIIKMMKKRDEINNSGNNADKESKPRQRRVKAAEEEAPVVEKKRRRTTKAAPVEDMTEEQAE